MNITWAEIVLVAVLCAAGAVTYLLIPRLDGCEKALILYERSILRQGANPEDPLAKLRWQKVEAECAD